MSRVDVEWISTLAQEQDDRRGKCNMQYVITNFPPTCTLCTFCTISHTTYMKNNRDHIDHVYSNIE